MATGKTNPSHTRPSCLLGMSGGTDSSVAAMLLQEQGYDVIGVTFRFWPSLEAEQHIADAKHTAERLGISHFVYDAQQEFRAIVVNYFIDEYLHGHTPVPCTRCNTQLKWPLLETLANQRGIEFIATGHYCTLVEKNRLYYIAAGADADKDQSFFLWALPQRILSKIIFPLGFLTKTKVRQYAAEHGFEHIAKKKDSLGVCFCHGDYRDFLRSNAPHFSFQKGNFVDENGDILGRHEGFPFYTVGQRRGLIHLNRLVYVKETLSESNTVVLAPHEHLFRTNFLLKNWTITNENDVNKKQEIVVKIRYRKQANTCHLVFLPDGQLQVVLHQPLDSIASGQAAVFYKDNIVLGGGIIS